VEEICGSQLSSIHIHPVYKDIGTPESGKKEYNMLLKSYGFWSFFPEEWLLCMETDSYLMKEIPQEVYSYNYVASKWPWVPGQAGGGGISHRKKSFMLEVCLTPIDAEMQDCFASEGLLRLGYPVMEGDLFGETAFDSTTIGTHQWWTFAHGVVDDLEAYLSLVLTLHMRPKAKGPKKLEGSAPLQGSPHEHST
jgi:hypothetical protein